MQATMNDLGTCYNCRRELHPLSHSPENGTHKCQLYLAGSVVAEEAEIQRYCIACWTNRADAQEAKELSAIRLQRRAQEVEDNG